MTNEPLEDLERNELMEDLRERLHHDGCVHDSAGGRFCWSLALIFESRFAALATGASVPADSGEKP